MSETGAICLHIRRQRWSHKFAHSLRASRHSDTPDWTATCKQICHGTCRAVRCRLRRVSPRPPLKSTSRLGTFASDSSPACQAQANGCDAELHRCLSAQHVLQRQWLCLCSRSPAQRAFRNTGNPAAFANTPASPSQGRTPQSSRTHLTHPTLVGKDGGLGPCNAIAWPGKRHEPGAGLNDVSIAKSLSRSPRRGG